MLKALHAESSNHNTNCFLSDRSAQQLLEDGLGNMCELTETAMHKRHFSMQQTKVPGTKSRLEQPPREQQALQH